MAITFGSEVGKSKVDVTQAIIEIFQINKTSNVNSLMLYRLKGY